MLSSHHRQGFPGTTAIHRSSAGIKQWAASCTVTRGLTDIADTGSGPASVGTDADATGMADGSVVSLGDSGVAVLTFNGYIFDGDGPDFAVFENGFVNPANGEEAFLELAFVEVSSDGEHFFRFPATSNTGISTQVAGAGDYMNARLVNNLAGKYIAQYGTPFDLTELKGTSGLDVSHVTHIRIVDVIGSVNAHHSHDAYGNVINDPYPTRFPSGGFDLDAVAAINTAGLGLKEFEASGFRMYPVPVTDVLSLDIPGEERVHVSVRDIQGRVLQQYDASGSLRIPMAAYNAGTYFLYIDRKSAPVCVGVFSKV
ncbi:MAG: T9SS type A sorting domain-containing protein [Chitinophagaceae bacterium]